MKRQGILFIAFFPCSFVDAMQRKQPGTTWLAGRTERRRRVMVDGVARMVAVVVVANVTHLLTSGATGDNGDCSLGHVTSL